MNTVRDNLMYCDLVSRNGIIHKVGVDGNCFRIVDAEGIPITPEILEKNGWLNGPYSRLSLQDGKWLEFYWREHRLQEYWEGIDEWQSHIKQLELVFKTECIFYVHELQHALRLCGLNELADNFKV